MPYEKSSFPLLVALANSAALSKVTTETEYGLVVELGPENSISAKLKDNIIISEDFPNKKGYKYMVSTSWNSGHLWYDTDWQGTPEGAYAAYTDFTLEGHDEVVKETARKAWDKAFKKWGDFYDEGFDKNLNKTGDFDQDPIPDKNEREAWAIQGMLLAVWLSLLPGVVSVEYFPDENKVLFDSKAEGENSIGNIMAKILADSDAFVSIES